MPVEKNVFQVGNCLDSIEKVALLNFMSHEFGLDQLLTIGDNDQGAIADFPCRELSRNKSKKDLIYCDLSDHSKFDPFLAEKILDLLSTKGVVCIDWEGCAEELRQIFRDTLSLVLEIPGFSIFARRDGTRAISSMLYQVDLFRRRYFFENERKNRCRVSGQPPMVTVIVLTYCHEQYIAECLNSVLTQQGNFRMRIIIIDDASSDQTTNVVRKAIAERCNDRLEIEFHINSHNCGVVKNLATAIRLAAGCDYLALCEGDDFWSSETRIQKHLDFLATHSECVMSFNTIELCSADGSSRRIHEEQARLTQEVLGGNSLAACNWIGNFTACFYDGVLIKIIPEKLFDMYTVDWMFNLYCSQFGAIGHVRKILSVYRQHEGGEWSNLQEWNKAVTLSKLGNDYNKFLDFQYNEGWQKHKKMLLGWMVDSHAEKTEKFDLIILDDVFPSQRCGSRCAEFTFYLKEFPKSIVLASGTTLPFLGEESLKVLLRKYQLRYPELGNQVMEGAGSFPVRLGKLLYVNSLTNAYALLSVAEDARVPFVFTLELGDGFGLNNPKSFHNLKRIFDSPCFLKVIVTQQIVHDYLINNRLCPEDKIELIFGMVMSDDPIPTDKVRYQCQMESRIRIMRELIEAPFIFDVEKWRGLNPCPPTLTANPLNLVLSPTPSPTMRWLRKNSPESIKNFYRQFIKRHVGSKNDW